MEKLRVSWADGLWNPFPDEGNAPQQVATADVPVRCHVEDQGSALVFGHVTGGEVYLVVPVARFISAVKVEVPE
jgi:hypothetical protein